MATITDIVEGNELSRIRRLNLFARQVVEGFCTGLHQSPHKGISVEFKQHRPYTHGDEIKRIDWKVFGRTDRHYIREYEEETNLRCTLIVDASGSIGYEGSGGQVKFEYAKRLASCLAYLMMGQGDSAGLVTFDTQVRSFIPDRQRTSHLKVIIEALEQTQVGEETGLTPVVRSLVPRLKRRGLVVLISDCFGDVPALLKSLAQLRHRGHEILIFQIWDRDELEFPFKQWTRFINLEAEGDSHMVDPGLTEAELPGELRKIPGAAEAGVPAEPGRSRAPGHRRTLCRGALALPGGADAIGRKNERMSFHNPWLLGGLAAFLIPLIIHILNKRRFKVVHWGAMHLLVDVVRKNNKRIRIEQLLLLLLRIAIPIILALCLARPFLTKMQQLFGNQKTSTVYLLDDSFSMQAGGSSASNFQKGTRAIKDMIKALPKGSDASVVLMGGGARTLLDDPTTALEVIGEKFEDVAGEGDPAAVSESIHEGAAELGRMSNSAQEVVIVSDFQEGDWEDSKAAAREGAMGQLEALEIPPLVTLFRVGDNLGENLAIESVEFSSMVFGVGQKATIRVNLRNFGKTSYPDTMVHLDVDGIRLRSSQVTIPPEGDAQVLFTHAFEQAGSHTATVSTSGDALEADNKFFASVPVWDEVKTLLVDGSPSDEPLGGATDFLEIALQPFGAAKSSLNDLITTQVIRSGELNRDRLKDMQVVVLANVPELNGGQLNDLKEFVKQGGGLIVFAGDKVKPDFYNRALFDDGKGILPLPYSGLGGNEAPGRILNQRHAHPVLEFFNDPRNGKLGDVEFTTWLKPEIPEETRAEVAAGARRDVATLLRLDDGVPYLVEKQFGKGRVIQSASGSDAGWGNLPTKPVFVPLVQRLVTYLAASVSPPVNLRAGDPLTAFLAKEESGKRAKLISPEGIEHELEVKREGERGVAEFKGTLLPGIYTLSDSNYGEQHFAVNLSRDESEIEGLAPEELSKLADGMGGRVVNSLEEYNALDDERRFGQEIWKPLLWVLLAFLFLEIFYQQWLTKREF